MSVLRTGRGAWRWGCGGGGLTENKYSAKKCSWGLKTQNKNVPVVLKRMQNVFFSEGGILGCLGRPTPPPGGRAGRKTIHFFL